MRSFEAKHGVFSKFRAGYNAEHMKAEQFNVHENQEQVHWWFVARRQIIERIVDLLVAQGSRLVDVGCGTGGNAGALSQKYEVVGIDPDALAIEIAKSHFPKAEFLCGQAPHDLPQRDRDADIFLLNDVLEHLENPRQELLVPLVESMKKGSYVLITVPSDPKLWSPHDVAFGHYRRYTFPTLIKEWEGLNVECISLSYFNQRLYPLIRLIRAVNSRTKQSSGRGGTDFAPLPKPINSLLTRIMAGESSRLERRIKARTTTLDAPGVSLLAILRKTDSR